MSELHGEREVILDNFNGKYEVVNIQFDEDAASLFVQRIHRKGRAAQTQRVRLPLSHDSLRDVARAASEVVAELDAQMKGGQP